MEIPPGNPDSNVLPAGIADEQVDHAIRSSGYPLQSRTIAALSDSFEFLAEEWGYIDRDENTYRTLDVFARQRLSRPHTQVGADNPLKVRPNLTALIECKQADLPYVFFRRRRPATNTALVVGLHRSKVEVSAADSRSTTVVDVPRALSLNTLPFATAPVISSTFSRLTRKGKDLELTGTDAYSSVIRPLVKAALHYEAISKPPSLFAFLDCTAVVLVAVVDAPMIAIDVQREGHVASYAPWVRVLRHEPVPGAQIFDTHRMFAIDCVHWGYLRTYVDDFLLPFASAYAERVERHHNELYHGRAFVASESMAGTGELETHLTFRS